VARIAAVVASDFRFAYFGTAAFAERLLRLDQKLMDGIPMNPRRMANLLNVTSTPMAGRLRYRLFEPPGAQTSVSRLWVSLRARRLAAGPVGDGAGRCGRSDRRRVGPAQPATAKRAIAV
jgi:hypothetical protein